MKKIFGVLMMLVMMTTVSFGYDVCTIFKAFENNALAAQSDYGGRGVTITGYVDSIERSTFGQLTLRLRCERLEPDMKCVIIYMQESALGTLSKLSRGDRVTVEGDFNVYFIWPIYDNGKFLKVFVDRTK